MVADSLPQKGPADRPLVVLPPVELVPAAHRLSRLPADRPYGVFSDDDLRGKRIRIDPRRIEVVPAAPGSKRNAVLFPIILNPDDSARRKELWVKAALTKEVDDRRSVENLLRDALQEIVREPPDPRDRAEDRRGRIQITDDVHAAVSETRQGAISVSLGV